MIIATVTPRWKKPTPVAIVAGIVIIALVLRLFGLGSRAFWFDETISAVYARQDIGTLFALNAGDNHPFGYYLTLKFWIDLFGNSDAIIRLLSVLPGTAAIWLVWLISRRLFPLNPTIGLLTAAITALSPFQLYFSQEARNYSFMQFWVLLAVWFWLRGLESNRWADWIGLGLAGGLGILYNFTTAFYLVALFLWPLLKAKENWSSRLILRMWLAGAGGGVLAGLVLLPKLTSRLSTIKGNFWIPTPDPLIVLRTFYTFIFGAVPLNLFLPAFALAFILLCVTLGQAIPAWWKDRANSVLSRPLWLLCVPIGLIIVVSLLFQPLYLDKALIACSPFYYMLVSWAIIRPGAKKRGAGILAGVPLLLATLLAISSLPGLYNGKLQPLYIARYNATQINAYLNGQLRDFPKEPAEAVITATDIAWLPLLYYGEGNKGLATYPIANYPYPNIFPLLVQTLKSETIPQVEIGTRFKQFWVVFEVNPPDGPVSAPKVTDLSEEPLWMHSPDWQKGLLAYFNQNFTRLKAVELDRVLLILYERK